ncbi:peptide methionine sulfoxide reductase, partial [Zopfochytrium polystomum]
TNPRPPSNSWWSRRSFGLVAVPVLAIVAALSLRKPHPNTTSTATSPSQSQNVMPSSHTSVATLAAGCFWGVEKSFRRKFPTAISSIKVGYAGGTTTTATYQQVCSGRTGHAEVIQFRFDPAEVSYPVLLDFFFRMHDPTTKNRQGGDVGTQYRSAIIVHDDVQASQAEEAIKRANVGYAGRIATTIEKFNGFIEGEEYHQDYLTKNPHGYECPTHFERSWEKIAAGTGGKVPEPL